MLNQQLRKMRLAKGWSLEELGAELGGVVTKQALSKYEHGKSVPSPKILNRLAVAFGVKSVYLIEENPIKVEFFGFRKRSDLRVAEENQIKSKVDLGLQQRVKISELLNDQVQGVPIREYIIKTLEDAEDSAESLRKKWKLGLDPISNVVDVLEDNSIHVIEIEANERFDGLSAVAYGAKNEIKAAAVIVKRTHVGERQRLNLSHELGHLVTSVKQEDNKFIEKVAFRFGAAFLAPRQVVFKEVGKKRTDLTVEEMLILKKKFGMSMQALLYRLKDLDIISQAYYTSCFRDVISRGWRKDEPATLKPEKSDLFNQQILRAFSEGLIDKSYAEELVNQKIPHKEDLSLLSFRALMRLSIKERRRILEQQSENMLSSYKKSNDEREGWDGGDFTKY